MVTVYKGDSKRIDLTFQNDDGSVLNLSGCTVYFTAKRSYTEPDSEAIIAISNSVHDIPESGKTHITLSGSNTNVCPGDYFAGFQLQDASSGVSTYDTDGLKILASPRYLL